MKFVYRILILLGVFIAALFFFGRDIPQYLFSAENEVVEMGEATFPVITIQVGEEEINRMYGYSSNLDEMLIRECITPLSADRTFTVNIDENECVIKKLKYDIFDEGGLAIESGSTIVLDNDTNKKAIKLQIQEPLKSGKEYIAKITLITDTSKRIYYYTRLKLYDNDILTQKLDFVRNFNVCTFDIMRMPEVIKYLEPKSKADNTTFAKVNIQSRIDMVSWGNLVPELVHMQVPTITEYYDSMASIRLDYIVSVYTDSGLEYYKVKECYRFNYTESRVYLYDFNRSMEAYYNPQLTSLTKSEFKLGITEAGDVQMLSNLSNKLIAFAYNREIWFYNADENSLTKVFSFRDGELDDWRELNDNHNVYLMNVSEEGILDFVVYGYMNRGEYEGRVGMVLYRFYPVEDRIEEQAYIPINCSYEQLCEEMTPFIYRNQYNIFMFSIFDTIYSYNLSTRTLEVKATDVPRDNLIFSKENGYIVWQECSDDTNADKLHVYMIEDDKEYIIRPPEGQLIRLLGTIDGNIIYGYANTSDVYIYADGTRKIPVYRLIIADCVGNMKKDYFKSGVYIDAVRAEGNMISLTCLKKQGEDKFVYVEAEDDYILNQVHEKEYPVKLTKRITDLTLTEYYISLPTSIEISDMPNVKASENTLINQDTTLRVNREEERTSLFYSYSFGDIIYSTSGAGEAVNEADTHVGTAINKDGRLVFERGVKSARREIGGVATVSCANGLNSVQACLKMIVMYKNIETDASSYNSEKQTVDEWLADHIKATPVNLTGATLDEVLYYTYKQRLVMGFIKNEIAVIITGYDQTGVTLYNPVTNKTMRYSTKEAAQLFEEEGNRFYSYID